jgi:DinB superfamily
MTAATTAPRAYNPISGSSCIAPAYASDLDVLHDDVTAVIDDAKSIVAGLSDAQFNWKPSAGRWSVAQCLEHLVLTGTFAANGQETAIAKLRDRGRRSDGPYVYRGIPARMGTMISKGVEPPVQKKFRTGRRVVPSEHHDRDALLAEFIAVEERLTKAIVSAKGLDLAAASVPLPIAMFSMRLGQSLAFEVAHARRHLWQARQVKASPGF